MVHRTYAFRLLRVGYGVEWPRTALQQRRCVASGQRTLISSVAVLFFHFSRLLLPARSYETIILRFRTFDIFKRFDLTK